MVLLLRALRNTSFYADSQIKIEKEGNLSKEEITIGKLLFKIRQIKDMNAHPVWGVELNPKVGDMSRKMEKNSMAQSKGMNLQLFLQKLINQDRE